MPTPIQRQQEVEDIQALKGLEAIRVRPGMYCGTGRDAVYHLIDNVLDYSLDEAMVDRCNQIEISIQHDKSIVISDNGSGLPVAIHPQEEISRLEAELTIMYCGGTLHAWNYPIHGGMHGVGLKAVNALSERLIAEVRRDGYLWKQTFARGERASDLIQVRPLEANEPTGTSITFLPDADVLYGINDAFAASFDILAERCCHIAYVLPGVTIRLRDERVTPLRETAFHADWGLTTFVDDLNRDRTILHGVVNGVKCVPWIVNGKDRGFMEITFAFQYTDDIRTTEMSFVNTVHTPEGGTHQAGIQAALTSTINEWVRRNGKDIQFTDIQILQGLTAIVSIKHPNPQFESQTIVELLNPEVRQAVSSVVAATFYKYLEDNPEQAQRIFDHLCHVAYKAVK